MIEFEIWTWREPTPNVDLTGFKVEAADGHIGKVDEATHEIGGSYIVVDTGPWIFGKKVMLPAGTIKSVDLEGKKVFVDRTKGEIKNAPEFDPERYKEEIYRDKIGGYYQDFYQK
jgi:PRC-barrel domain protein